jgi:hypothetical protein
MAAVAGQGPPVRACSCVAAGMTGFGLAVAVLLACAGVEADGPGVDRAEGRGGEGREHDRVRGDGIGDALAARQSGAEQVEGVAAVGFGAAGAGGSAAVAAGLVDRPVGQVVGADRAGYLASDLVDVADVTAQQYGPGAGGGGPDVRQPGVVGVSPDGRSGVGLFRAGIGGADEPAVASTIERRRGGVKVAGNAAIARTRRRCPALRWHTVVIRKHG